MNRAIDGKILIIRLAARSFEGVRFFSRFEESLGIDVVLILGNIIILCFLVLLQFYLVNPEGVREYGEFVFGITHSQELMARIDFHVPQIALVRNNKAVALGSAFFGHFGGEQANGFFRRCTLRQHHRRHDGFTDAGRFVPFTIQQRIHFQHRFIGVSRNGHIYDEPLFVEAGFIKDPIFRCGIIHSRIAIRIFCASIGVSVLFAVRNVANHITFLVFSCFMNYISLVMIGLQILGTAENRTSVLRQIRTDDDSGACECRLRHGQQECKGQSTSRKSLFHSHSFSLFAVILVFYAVSIRIAPCPY